MRNITKRNLGISVLLVALPYFVALYVSNARLTWVQSILITKITNYITMTLICVAGISLIVMNVKALKLKVEVNKILSILFIFLGLTASLYGLFVLILMIAFRNGINF